jgi:hypothetical protein
MGSTAILDSATGVCCKLQQEKDVTVRWLRCMPIMRVLAVMRVSSLWRMQLGEVMDQVWTRDRQEREECQEGSARAETHALDAHGFPP